MVTRNLITDRLEAPAEAAVNQILAPLIVLPDQYFPPLRLRELQGERRLLFAVLQDAVSTVLCHRNSRSPLHQREYREARRWIYSRNRGALFDFETLCELLDVDPGQVRRNLLRIGDAQGLAQAPEPMRIHNAARAQTRATRR